MALSASKKSDDELFKISSCSMIIRSSEINLFQSIENRRGLNYFKLSNQDYYEVLQLYQAEVLKNSMLQEKIEELLVQITTNKLFMNMVIHDMRNPTGAIEFGVMQSIDNL